MKVVAIIPARYGSSRFPGKPLADICGKPMIWWVYQQCKKVGDFDAVYVATDDQRIYDTCTDLNIEVLMTSDKHKTGTDRIGEVARKISADLIVNIHYVVLCLFQGRKIINMFALENHLLISNGIFIMMKW